MIIRGDTRVRHLLLRMRAWPLLQLPRWLIAFVIGVVVADALAIALAAHSTVLRPANLLIFGLMVACGAITVEMTRRCGETAMLIKDVCGVWELPMAILLPPVYALIAPLPRIAMTQWRIYRAAPHRRVFTAAAISLSYGAVYLAFHQFSRPTTMSLTSLDPHAATWVLTVAACFLLQWVVNVALVLPAVKGSDRSAKLGEMLFARESVHNDLIEACVAVLVTVGVALTPVVTVFALPFVTLLQRSSRHAHLVAASRIDSKTGLLNATTWRREAGGEVTRSQRTGSAVAVALVDIDHFKGVNDTHGHLAGDDALRAVSRALVMQLREYDLVGRFGGEEFALLLPQTDAPGAANIAERIRTHVAGLRIDGGSPASLPITVTVSIGVAVLGNAGQQLTEVLAAADAALYRAKDAGRNQVWVTTDNETFSASSRELAR